MLSLMTTCFLNAQNTVTTQGRVGYINSDSILVKVPEYLKAQKELEDLSKQYRSKIDADLKKIETLYQSYQSSKASLSQYQRADKEAEIIRKENELKELQKVYFGQDGYLQKKSEELLNPIKIKVQASIDKIAKNGKFMIIFDLAAIKGVVYNNPSDNLNSFILKELGYN